MAAGETGRYRLAPRARADIEEIWRYSAETWSMEQADRYVDRLARVFETIALMPLLARERREFTPPVRIQVHEGHLIVYVAADDHVAIVRVLGGRQDWVAILMASDL
jgi:toxin ParE1/3/4